MKSERQPRQPQLTTAWKEDIQCAIDTLRRGGVILYPTDTIWGIGCDATCDAAVRRIFEIKRRADAKAMLSLVASDGQLQRHVRHVPEVAWQIIDCATSPITIIYDGVQGISPALLAEDGSAGFRMTAEPFSHTLCYRLGRPLVSTSANISGQPAPRCFDEIAEELRQAVDYVCTSRRNEKNPPSSSILKIRQDGEITIIRK